jgi:hypothetical protein
VAIRRGWLAEFDSVDALATAAAALHTLGYRALETYSPFPVPQVDARLGLRRSRLGRLVFGGGVTGALLGYGIQWYADVKAFPLMVGGRPLHAVPAFIPATFEATVLGAALAAFFGFLMTLRLPELWHPVFEVEGFERASADRFWIAVGDEDPLFDAERTRDDLAPLHPIRLARLPEATT